MKSGIAALLDPRLGIIRRLEIEPLPAHLPAGLRHARAEIADSRAFSPWASDASSGGFSWWDDEAALGAAAGEAIERYCGNVVSGGGAGLRRASFAELATAGEPAIDPADLALFSEEQHAIRGFPFVPFTRDLRVLWTRGEDLTTGTPCWVPASWVWTTWNTGPAAGEPKTNGTIFAGIAAGRSREEAERGTLAELIERDAVHLAWTSGAPLPRLIPPRWMEPLLVGGGGAVTIELYHFPNEFGLPVIGALLRDHEADVLAMGQACRTDPMQAALKAVAEAAQLDLVARALADRESGLADRLAAVPGASLHPWRADRTYASLFGPDWRGARDLLCHLQLYLDPALREPLAERLIGPELPLTGLSAPGPESRETYLKLLNERDLRAVSVDVTTPDVASAGLRVVRVVVPGLYSNAPAAFPYLGGCRLAAAGGVHCTLPPPYA